MAESLGVATLELTTDDTKLKRGLDSAERTAEATSKSAGKKFSGGMTRAALPAAAALGLVAVKAKQTIDAASDLDEQVNKTAVVFGENGKEVHAWSKGLVKNFGLSQRAALEAAGTYGNMLKPMGLLPAQTKKISMGMVELAGDLASFNNASPKETLDALRAGLSGEAEPLRRFGVFLSEATIEAEALSMGLVKAKVDMGKLGVQQEKTKASVKAVAEALKEHGKDSDEYRMAVAKMEYEEGRLAKALEGKVPKLTAAQKAQASYGVIVRSTADANGDFARTSDSVANSERIQAAQTENLNAKIGKGLIPVYRTYQGVVRGLTGFMAEHTTGTKIAVGVIAGLALGVLAVNAGIRLYRAAVVAATAAQVLFNLAMTANPIVLVGIAIAGLAAAVVVAYKKSETFRKIVDGLWGKIKDFGNWIKTHWGTISEVIQKSPMVLAFKAMATAIGKVVDGVKWLLDKKDKVTGFLGGVADKLNPFGDPRDPNMTAPPQHGHSAGVNLMGASPVMSPFAAAASAFGLRVTSGLRPGAITANGTPSDHGIGKALDVSNGYDTPQMAAFFRSLIGNPAVKQAFYDPLGSIFGGQWSSYREGGHSDHVHVATYDTGGWLKPGLTLAYNGTGKPERVVGPGGDEGGDIIIQIDREVLGRVSRREAALHARRGGS